MRIPPFSFCSTHDVVDCSCYKLLTMSETRDANTQAEAYHIVNVVGSAAGLNGSHGTFIKACANIHFSVNYQIFVILLLPALACLELEGGVEVEGVVEGWLKDKDE